MLLKFLVGLIGLFYLLFIYTSFLLSVSGPSEFYNASFTQMITPAIQILTLFTIAYYINVVISKKNKENEVFGELTDSILGKFDDLREELENYFSVKEAFVLATSPQQLTDVGEKIEKSEREILHLFRVLSNKEHFQNEMYEELEMEDLCKNRDNSTKITDIKKEVTIAVFKQSSHKYSVTQKQAIRKLLEELIRIYTKEKIYLYTVK